VAAMRTCSQVVFFSQQMEEALASAYAQLAALDQANQATYVALAGESRAIGKRVRAAYVSSISDAIEGCFSFHLEEQDYQTETTTAAPAGRQEALERASRLERTIARFYMDACAQSRTLMPDVSRAFAAAAKRRQNRLDALQSVRPEPGS